VQFSARTVEFLVWLHCGCQPAENQLPDDGELRNGELWLLWEAYRALRETELGEHLRRVRAVQTHPLIRLCFPADRWSDAEHTPDWEQWLTRSRVWMLEAAQTLLARCTLDWNARLRSTGSPDMDADDGSEVAQDQRVFSVLNGAIAAFAARTRWDLLRFLLSVFKDVSTAHQDATAQQFATRGGQAPVRRLATPLRDVLFELRELTERLRQVAYYDAGYSAAQLWLRDWEHGKVEDCCRLVRDHYRAGTL
jgi:hypothetical protein